LTPSQPSKTLSDFIIKPFAVISAASDLKSSSDMKWGLLEILAVWMGQPMGAPLRHMVQATALQIVGIVLFRSAVRLSGHPLVTLSQTPVVAAIGELLEPYTAPERANSFANSGYRQ
jgi:hypothetical protein